jgi:molecular chaperone GrpE
VSEEQINREIAEPAVNVTTDTTPSLEEMLRQAELNAQEHHDAWLRAKAETENVRRRAVEDVEKARKFALDKFAVDLLTVKDSLEAALATGDNASLESVKSGVELTLKQLSGVFEIPWARNSTRTATRPSAWWTRTASPIASPRCCRRATSSMSG